MKRFRTALADDAAGLEEIAGLLEPNHAPDAPAPSPVTPTGTKGGMPTK